MKYSGVKKVESISVVNNNNQVVKVKKRHSKFLNIVLIQFCICLFLVCGFSIARLFISDSQPVFSKNKTDDIFSFEVSNATSIENVSGELVVKQPNNLVNAIYGGEVIEVTDNSVKVKYNDKLTAIYKNVSNCLFTKGEKVVKGKVFALKLKGQDLKLSIMYGDKPVTAFEISGKKVKWQSA